MFPFCSALKKEGMKFGIFSVHHVMEVILVLVLESFIHVLESLDFCLVLVFDDLDFGPMLLSSSENFDHSIHGVLHSFHFLGMLFCESLDFLGMLVMI